jgi:arylsulfatase A-like enzyme
LTLSKRPISADSLILLVTIDSLRRDFAYNSKNMPFMESLPSTKFVNAFSQGGGTPESFPSIMCSVPPPYHFEDRQIVGRMSIAKLLKECGFATGGFHSNPFLGRKYGYGDGFDLFDESIPSDSISVPDQLQDAKNAINLLFRNKAPIVNGQEITRRALTWLRNERRGKKFLWVHFMDTHFPYLPKTRDIGFSKSMNNRILWEILLATRSQYKKSRASNETKTAITNSYSACIRHVDSCLATIFSEISKRFNDIFAIVTSDHGEAFWEHGYFGHSGVYDEILKVPFFIYSSSSSNRREIKQWVFLSDIFPTISSVVGQFSDSTYGQDLNARCSTPEENVERGFVCTSLDIPFQSRTIGFRKSKFKYVRDEKLYGAKIIRENLFDLTNDQEEVANVLDSHRQEADQARHEIAKIYGGRKAPQSDFTYEDEQEIMQRLKSLGYV